MDDTYYNGGLFSFGGAPQWLMGIASFLAALISLYSLLIWLRIILTWIRIPGQGGENPLSHYLGKIVDPYLAWFKGISTLKRSNLDLTPLIALAVLSVVQSVLRLFGSYGKITVGMVFALILSTLWSFLLSPILWFIMALLGVRLYFCYKRGPSTLAYIKMLDSLVGGVLNWVQSLFYKNKTINDRQLVITSLIFFVLVYLGSSALLRLLMAAFAKLSF
ncbi:MAG TPA: YggT family protein [Sphaerochaeta sp.]|nr:YggT family protein [Sphaerochaeta sp.]